MTPEQEADHLAAKAGIAAAREQLKGREREICDWFAANLGKYPQGYTYVWFRWWEIIFDCEKALGLPTDRYIVNAIGEIYWEWQQAINN